MPPKKPSKAGKRQGRHAAAGGATREEREKEEEEEMKKQVAMEMNRINGEKRDGDDYTSRTVRAKKIASIRSGINWNLQYSVATLPRFGLPINCTVQDLKNFFQDRRIRYRMLGSYHLENGIVVTAPKAFRTYHLIDMLSDDPDTPQKSIVQFIIDEYSNYLSAFRPTPEDDPYKPGGFYVFMDLEAPLSIWFVEDKMNFIMPWASVGYDKLDEVEVSKGFLKRMTDKLLNNFTPENYKKKIAGKKAMLETPIVIFGEGQRSREFEDFICVNFDSPVPIFVTYPLNTLIHSWSGLSKVALHFLIAIVELQIGARDARHSFVRARQEMYLLFDDLSKLNLNSVLLEFEENGVFSLKSLLGRYLLLVKYEPGLVARLIIRGVDNFTGEYDRYSKDAEPTLEDLEPNLMLQQQEEDREVTGHEEKKKLTALVNKLRTQVGEEEYLRWVSIKESGKDLLAELMK